MEKFTDVGGDVWVRHLVGIDFGHRNLGSYIRVQGESCFRIWSDGGRVEFEGGLCERIKAAWAALMTPKEVPFEERIFTWRDGSGSWRWGKGPESGMATMVDKVPKAHARYSYRAGDEPCGYPTPGLDEAIAHYWPKVERPETWRSQTGSVWHRDRDGIRCSTAGTHPIYVRADGAHTFPSDPRAWCPLWPQALEAWEALVGEPLPAESEGVPDLAPAHHWSFVCTPERVDIARVYREMAAQGVDRKDVKIVIRPHGKKNLRVAVSSRGAQ